MHLVCGEALYDVFVDSGETDRAGEVSLRAVAGGSPFNVAIGMARLGVEAALATDLADDVLGARLRGQLVSEGVVQTFLRRSAAATALAIVMTDEHGRPSYRFCGLEQPTYCPSVNVVDRHEGRIKGIHLGSIAMVLPNSSNALIELVRRFADRALISLDPNVRLSIIPERATWRRAIEDLRPSCQVIKISDEDIAALYDDADPEMICRGLLTDRTALVVLTKGSEGAVMFTRAVGRIEVPRADTAVADTVGAGDSFMAALLSGLTRSGYVSASAIASLHPGKLMAIGRLAALAAGMTCSRRGPVLPTAQELTEHDAECMDFVG